MATSGWSAGLCGCGDGCGVCCLTWYCPCVTFGRNAEAVDEGHSSCVVNCCIYALLMTLACQCLYSCAYRKKLRSKYGLRPEPCGDCCVHFCCGPCALCQEHAELKRRGAFDHPKGYVAPTQHVMHR